MKFTTYQAAVEPNTMHPPAVRVSSDVNAYGSGGEEYGKLGAAIGQVNKVLAQRRDDLDAADVMKARNEIMTSLTQQLYGENGLFVTGVGENAKGLMGRTTNAINQTYDDVSKNYNDRVKYALKGNLNENMANFQRIAASKEMAEGNEVRRETFAANMDNSNSLAGLNYNNPDFLEAQMRGDVVLINARAQQEGWTGAQREAAIREHKTKYFTTAAGAAMSANDPMLASTILEKHRSEISPDAYWGVMGKVKAQNEQDNMVKTVDDILERHKIKNPDGTFSYDMEGAYAEIDGLSRKVKRRGGGGSYLDTGHGDMDKWLGQSAKKYNLDLTLLHKVAQHESHYNGAAVSNAGALGVMQLMPGTAEGLGVDPYDDRQNIDGGAKYLKQCLDASNGDVHEALARYNGGPNYYKSAEAQRYADEVLAEQINGTMAEGGGAATYNLPTQGADIDEQVNHLKPVWRSEALPAVGGILNEMGLADGAVISSGARSREHNREVGGAEHSHHIDDGDGGDAVDIVLPDGTTPAQAEEVRRRFEASGAFGEVLYHTVGSGWHLHLGEYKGGLMGGDEDVDVPYTEAEKERLRRFADARNSDNEKFKQARTKANFDNTMTRIDQSSDYTSAVLAIDNSGLPLDDKQRLMSMAAHKFGITASGSARGSSVGGRAGGGRSGSGYNPSKDIEIMKKMNARIDTGTKISSDQFVAYKSAALRLDDSGLLGNEYQDLQNNPEVWSQITDDIETGGLDKAMKRLISCGVDPVTACALLAKSDVSTALTNDFEDEGEESHDEYQGTD